MFVRSSLSLALFCLLLSGTLLACAEHNPDPEPISSAPPDLGEVGLPSTFDVATWNIQSFPQGDEYTLERVQQIIESLQVDIIAVQEVNDSSALHDLASRLSGWEAIVANQGSYAPDPNAYNPPVGFLYNSNEISLQSDVLIYTNEALALPRPPLRLDVLWHETPLTIINVHLKALGDGQISHDDPWDEEVRRMRGCELLDEYIQQNLVGNNVVVLGDFNDRIEEPEATNVFGAFLDRPERYAFADAPMVESPSHITHSLPGWGSHIDHVLVTVELFDDLARPNSECRTLPVEGLLSEGWAEYEAFVSDHRPVYLRLDF